MVLMADGSQKPIQDIVSGDEVIGLYGKPNRVERLHRTILGRKRTMMNFRDGSLAFTSDHPMWVKQDGKEYWGTHDYNQYLRGIGNPYPGLISHPLVIVGNTEYAYINGWKSNENVVEQYPPGTEVYSLVTDGDHSFIANGYVVGGFENDRDCDYDFKWEGLNGYPHKYNERV